MKFISNFCGRAIVKQGIYSVLFRSELGALTKDSKKDKSKKLNQTEQPTKSKKNN